MARRTLSPAALIRLRWLSVGIHRGRYDERHRTLRDDSLIVTGYWVNGRRATWRARLIATVRDR